MTSPERGPGAPVGRRVLVVGAGSLGSIYGALFSRGGCDVQLLARRTHAEAIEEQGGLRVESPEGQWVADLRAEWCPERLHPADTIVLLTKTPDTAEALRSVDHLRDGASVVLSLQNGVEKDRHLTDWCGAGAVVGASSMVGATLASAGAVRLTFPGPTFLGELPDGTSARVRAVAAQLRRGGADVVESDRIQSVEWSKLSQATASMSLAALTRLHRHEVLLQPRLASLYLRLLRETAAVARAAGVEVDDWPAMVPVRSLVGMGEDEGVQWLQQMGRGLVEAGHTGTRISMLQSIDRGRPLELDAVQPFVVREGRRLGVPTPTVDLCAELLQGLDAHIRGTLER